MPARRSSVGAIFLTVVVDLVGFGIVLPLLPLYAKDFDASRLELGLLIASFSAMQLIFAPVWGRVSDRVGRRPVLLIGLGGSVISYTVFAFADGVPLLFAARIGAGICGATISTAAAYIADVTPPEQRARGMALIGAAFGIGFTLGPPLGFYAAHLGEVHEAAGTLSHPLSRALPGLLAATLSLGSFVWTLLSVGEPARRAAEPRRVFDLAALRGARSPGAVLLLLGFSLLSVIAFSSFESTLSLMLLDRFGLKEMAMGRVFLFIGVTLALVQGVIVRRIAGPLGEHRMIRGGFLVMAAGLAGLAFSDGLGALHASLAVAVTGFGCVTPSLTSLVSRHAIEGHQGGILGLGQSASALGRILGPIVGNIAYAPLGPDGAPLAAVTLPLLGATDHHRLPYLFGAGLALFLATAAFAVLPHPPADG